MIVERRRVCARARACADRPINEEKGEREGENCGPVRLESTRVRTGKRRAATAVATLTFSAHTSTITLFFALAIVRMDAN